MFQCREQKNLCIDRKRGLTWNIKMPRSTSRRTSEKNARARGKHHVRKPPRHYKWLPYKDSCKNVRNGNKRKGVGEKREKEGCKVVYWLYCVYLVSAVPLEWAPLLTSGGNLILITWILLSCSITFRTQTNQVAIRYYVIRDRMANQARQKWVQF